MNWFAWYVYFYMFCMLLMPFVYKGLHFAPIVNLGLLLGVPYLIEVCLYCVPNNAEITFIHNLISCVVYLPCFLIGFWMADNQIIEKFSTIRWSNSLIFNLFGIAAVFGSRICISGMFGFLLDVFYAPLMICFLVGIFQVLKQFKIVDVVFSTLGKYSTEMWFFHAVFFSTYVKDWFQPLLMIVSWPPLMFVWLVILSLAGAVIYQWALVWLQSMDYQIKRRK